MTVLVGFVAQLLHIALTAAAAPTLVGVLRWLTARLDGRVGASVSQPWRDLRRLLHKQALLADSASAISDIGPLAGAAAVAVAACLVPSFTLGMTLAPLADLLVIAGLLSVARCALALVAMDAGTATGGQGASRIMLLAVLSEPALLLAVLVLGLLAGSLDLDVIAAMQSETGTDWAAAVGLGLAATLLVALVDASGWGVLGEEASGADRALFEATDAMRLLVWCNLIGAMFLPLGMAPAGAGPLAWSIGLAGWLGRTLALVVALAALHAVVGRLRLVTSVQVLGVAVLLGLIATMVLFAASGSA
jgi:formate hydrogenlyase subunit 4